MLIPKKIHIVWIGDETKTPVKLIDTWRKNNPDWQVVLWDNTALSGNKWINTKHIIDMLKAGYFCGAADIMRYEILFNEGGFAVDADSISLRPLEDWLFDSHVCTTWENEITRPGLIANGYLASAPQTALLAEVISTITETRLITADLPWKMTGPGLLTEVYRKNKYANITVWPSHYFLPEHFTGQRYLGSGHIFAKQLWGSTRGISNKLCDITLKR